MNCLKIFSIFLALIGSAFPRLADARTKLDLNGYTDQSGAITIVHRGQMVDPYFAIQALLLAHENGLDISPYDEKWVNWLISRQKPDGNFERYCPSDDGWATCKPSDADDALLALWMKLLETMPVRLSQEERWQQSHQKAEKSLASLLDPARGVYLVSESVRHGLLMDNLEVWSYRKSLPTTASKKEARKLAEAIHKVFWDKQEQRFLVSTQEEQRLVPGTFYPAFVAQIFPLLFDYAILPTDRSTYYQRWMRQYRRVWLSQTHTDYAWGLLAVLAVRQNDKSSARCWLREVSPYRHSGHWTVTDEVAYQILADKRIKPAGSKALCK